MKKLNKKILARLAFIQFLYQKYFFLDKNLEYSKSSALKESEEFFKNMFSHNEKVYEGVFNKNFFQITPSYSHFKNLVQILFEHISSIDQIIYSRCKKKSFQIDLLISSILRPAICELKYFENIPKKVVVNEYTNLAENLLDHYHVGFVNFVLDSYAKFQ